MQVNFMVLEEICSYTCVILHLPLIGTKTERGRRYSSRSGFKWMMMMMKNFKEQ